VTVSKNASCTTSTPPARRPAARVAARPATRVAIARSPSGPWYTAYIEAITASSTCAVQMLLVAFSRRMCCSRVCKASRYAGAPAASFDTPTSRPGSDRASPSRTAMNAACGPPYPRGTPNRCVEPTATSAPADPGERSRVSASRSAATVTSAPAACAASISAAWSRTFPDAPGYWRCSPKYPSGSGCASLSTPSGSGPASKSTTRTSMPSGTARVRITAIVCGSASASTTYTLAAALDERRARVIASAAAVASSSSDAPAIGSPVRSATMVWKLSSASRRPWEISGWYGV
jgi:hypothetical protein